MVLQNRRTKKHHSNGNKKSASNEIAERNPTKSNDDQPKEKASDPESLYMTFIYHPIVIITAFIALPYIFYISYYFMILQRPDILNMLTYDWIQFRPAVKVQDERQLLIVGSMSAGTVQVTHDLNTHLGVEMAHESSDTEWNYARDGTVSWFHGIRFMNPPSDPKEKWKAIADICVSPSWNKKENMVTNMGFHPGMYRPPKLQCSYREIWNECWTRECANILSSEWGCAQRRDCEINFHANLHQVRNPLRTMESLYAKFCHVPKENEEGKSEYMDPSFLLFANSIFYGQQNFENYSCFDAVGNFVLLYNEALIEARQRGEIHDFYRIEDVSTCDIAKKAGWLSLDTTVYQPHTSKIQEKCANDSTHVANAQKVSKTKNKINKEYIKFGWEDFTKKTLYPKDLTSDLEQRMKALFLKVGYDVFMESI